MYRVACSLEPPVVGRQHIDPIVVGREEPGRLSQVWSTEICLFTVQDLTSSQFGKKSSPYLQDSFDG